MVRRRGKARRTAARPIASPLGGPFRPPPDPPAVNRTPWFRTCVVLDVAAGGGSIPISLIASTLVRQLSLTCVELDTIYLSLHKALVYTSSYENASPLTESPELGVSFSTVLLQENTPSVPTTAARIQSDVGTPAMPAKVGFRWGVLGRTPQLGSGSQNIMSIASAFETDVYVYLSWTSGGYLTFADTPVVLRPNKTAASAASTSETTSQWEM